MSLQWRIYLLVLFSILPALGVQVYGSYQDYEERRLEVGAQALGLAQAIAGEVDGLIETGRAVMVSLAQFAALPTDAAGCSKYMLQFLEQ